MVLFFSYILLNIILIIEQTDRNMVSPFYKTIMLNSHTLGMDISS